MATPNLANLKQASIAWGYKKQGIIISDTPVIEHICDRCGQRVKGKAFTDLGFIGFYDSDGQEREIARYYRKHPTEEVICWECLWDDSVFLFDKPWLDDPWTREILGRVHKF